MPVKYKGQTFMSDDDLKVKLLGFWPSSKINNPKLNEMFRQEFGRDFLGGDEIVSYAQHLVSSGMDFDALEEEIMTDIENPEKPGLEEIIFKKTATGIGRGHSLGGLSGIVLGIHGTKMIDSGLTGLVSSRSLVTSSRRRETTTDEIVIPHALLQKEDLLDEYLEVSREVFNLAEQFKDKFGNLGGIETFNKVIPYNNPADLFIVLPLDTLATIAFEVRYDRIAFEVWYDRNNSNGNFVPRELHALSDMFSDLTKKAGISTMFDQRIRVPRDTYFHYTVFKDPSLKADALEEAELNGMPLEPIVIDHSSRFTPGTLKGLERLKKFSEENMRIDDPKELAKRSMEYMLALRAFVGEHNESVRVKILDSLSWRVWSEQKRHATLRQSVESVYSAVERASKGVGELWPAIEEVHRAYSKESNADFENVMKRLEKSIVIDDRLKKHPQLLIPYAYSTARQLRLYQKLIDEGIEPRDALYIAPKNIRVRTLENYDLINLIDLELPLRLCDTCEPERKFTSWKKRDLIAQVVPKLDYFLYPKCIVGFCTEGTYCGHLTARRKYDKDLHKATKQEMLDSGK